MAQKKNKAGRSLPMKEEAEEKLKSDLVETISDLNLLDDLNLRVKHIEEFKEKLRTKTVDQLMNDLENSLPKLMKLRFRLKEAEQRMSVIIKSTKRTMLLFKKVRSSY